jgi:4-hydroxy-tetrahydrodipicolinate synthase
MENPLPSGIYPMLYAFFDDSGNLRPDPFMQQVDITLNTDAAGIAILGLATEVSKLTIEERCRTVQQVAARINGRKQLIVTVYGNTPKAQIDFALTALSHGASALILQAPAEKLSDAALKQFFAQIISAVDCPTGIQNAPEFLGFGLNNTSLIELAHEHSNFIYGKMLAALRMGIATGGARAPALTATEFGSACVSRFAEQLGKFS